MPENALKIAFILTLILLVVIWPMLICLIGRNRNSDYDQQIDDAAQIEYLDEYAKKHPKRAGRWGRRRYGSKK